MKTKTLSLAVTLIAILTGCSSKTCTLTGINNYSEYVVIYVSEQEAQDAKTSPKYTIELPAGRSASESGVDVSNLFASFYVGTGNKDIEGNVELKYAGCMDLRMYAGTRYVTLNVNSNGQIVVAASDM